MNIVLLNPPGKRAYMRGYFCSQTSKASYLPHPIDFVMLSAHLKQSHSVFLVDAIRDRLSAESCFKAVSACNPDAVIFLSGIVSWKEDSGFVCRLKNSLGVKTIGIGDIFLDDPAGKMKDNSFLDAIILDFSSPDPAAYLEGRFEALSAMVFRSAGVIKEPSKDKRRGGEFRIPVPSHEMFIHPGYIYPFVKRARFASVLTDYGCPFGCSFCVMSTLGYKYRPFDNIIPELDYVHGMGVREIFFVDQSFGVCRERNKALYDEMIRRKYGFGWVCYSRVDLVNREMLSIMKKAGCHTIMFGVESASDEILSACNKGYTVARIREAFSECRALGIRTVGTFILGLPQDTRQTCLATIDFARELECDFVSFNFAFPRSGTDLRRDMIRENLFDAGENCDQSGSDIAIRSRYMSAREISFIRDTAVRRFYMRPSYWLKQILSTSTPDEAVIKLKNFAGIIANMFRAK